MHAIDKYLAILDGAPCVFQIDTPLTHGFDLRAEQLNAGLRALNDKIVVKGLFIGCNRLQITFVRCSTAFHPLLPRSSAG